jgi:hypothetical protein
VVLNTVRRVRLRTRSIRQIVSCQMDSIDLIAVEECGVCAVEDDKINRLL